MLIIYCGESHPVERGSAGPIVQHASKGLPFEGHLPAVQQLTASGDSS